MTDIMFASVRNPAKLGFTSGQDQAAGDNSMGLLTAMAQKRRNPDIATAANGNLSAMPWKSLNLSKLHTTDPQNTREKFVPIINGAVPV